MCVSGVFWGHIPKLSLVNNLGFFGLYQDTFSGDTHSPHLGGMLLFLPSDPIVVLLPEVDEVHLQPLPQLHEPAAIDALCCFYRICTGTSITWGHTPAEQNQGPCCLSPCQYNPNLPTCPQWEQPLWVADTCTAPSSCREGEPMFPWGSLFWFGKVTPRLWLPLLLGFPRAIRPFLAPRAGQVRKERRVFLQQLLLLFASLLLQLPQLLLLPLQQLQEALLLLQLSKADCLRL